jgi:hypothetical protein
MLAGCASNPIELPNGMKLKEAERNAHLSSFGGIKYYGMHPNLPGIEIYISWDRMMSEKYQFYKNDPNKSGLFYFKDGILISNDQVDKLLQDIENESLNAIKKQKDDAEKYAIESAENIKKQKIIDDRIAVNNTATDNILRDKKGVLMYKKDDFSIVEINGKLIYLRNGAIEPESNVARDIAEYEAKKIMQKTVETNIQNNLNRNWLVNAQGRRNGASTCNVTAINPSGRDDDGNAIFKISTQCRSPAGSGSSGSHTIKCGTNLQRSHSFTSFLAQCQ